MKVSELAKESGWQVFSKGEDRAVESGYCGDFLSNIISRAPDSCAWLTVMNNVNVAAVATLIDCACILLAEGMPLDADARARAEREEVPVLATPLPVYQAARKVEDALNGV